MTDWGSFQSAHCLILCLNISRNSWQVSKDPERPSSCFSYGFVGECRKMPPPSFISVKKGWKPLAKSMRTPCWSLLWSFLTTLCSVMNIGALSRIWHLPARQTLPRSGSGGFSGLNYSGWFRVYWPFSSSDLSPMDSKSGQCLNTCSVRRGAPNIEILKPSLMKAVADFPKETLHNSIDGWPQRLRDCVKTKSSHFEKWLVLNIHYTCR